MDLLETILRTANAYEHIDTFRNEGIDAKCLKLLTDEDLTSFGIKDPEVRKQIMLKAEHLQITSENKIDLQFNKMYVNTVLSQIIHQMILYNATLTPLALQPDIVNVTVPLANACEALSTAIDDLHLEVISFKDHVMKAKGISKPQKSKAKSVVISGVLLSVFVVANVAIFKKVVGFIRQ